MYERYGALFALRNHGGDKAITAIIESLGAKSALLRHEVGYNHWIYMFFCLIAHYILLWSNYKHWFRLFILILQRKHLRPLISILAAYDYLITVQGGQLAKFFYSQNPKAMTSLDLDWDQTCNLYTISDPNATQLRVTMNIVRKARGNHQRSTVVHQLGAPHQRSSWMWGSKLGPIFIVTLRLMVMWVRDWSIWHCSIVWSTHNILPIWAERWVVGLPIQPALDHLPKLSRIGMGHE